MNINLMIGKGMLLAGVASSILVLGPTDNLSGQQPQPSTPSAATAASGQPSAKPTAPARYAANRMPPQAELYYVSLWGIDSLRLKYTESGELIRFSWRVVDPVKAAPLSDKKLEASLIDPQNRIKLTIPQMQNVGLLRQSSTPIAGKEYWMAFSNSGRRVKPGAHVNIEIGHFHAMNVVVE